jgi:hypothetical protein
MNTMHRFWQFLLQSPFLMAGLLVAGALIFYSAPLHSWNGEDTGGDTGAAELLPIAILQFHSLDFDQVVAEHPSILVDNSLPYYLTVRNGRTISFYPIVPGLLNVPAYAVAKKLGVDLFRYRRQLSMVTSVVVCALSVGFMYLALLAACSRPAVALGFTIFYALGTEVWSQLTRTLWQHGPSLMLLTAALAILLRGHSRNLSICGFLLGLAVWNRPTNILIALPLVVFVVMQRRRQAVSFLAAMATPLAAMSLYSFLYCGSVTYLGQGRSPINDVSPGSGAFGGNLVHGLIGLLLNPNRGLLIFNPVFIAGFAFLGFSLFSRTVPRIYRYLAVATGLMLFVYGRWGDWWGGWSFGYRLLSELVPILVIASALAWQQWVCKYAFARWTFAVAIAYCFYIHFLGALYYPTSHFNPDPVDIDNDQRRLWSVSDGEIARDHKMFLADLKTLVHGHLPVAWPERPLEEDAPPPTAVVDADKPIVSTPMPFLPAGDQASGNLEIVGPPQIAGWAWDPDHPDKSVSVAIYDGQTPIMAVIANLFRGDLQSAGIGDGHHGFSVSVPQSLLDGATHHISARVLGSNLELTSSPTTMPTTLPTTMP